VIEFAYVTGWRVASEIVPLQWRQVDIGAGEIRLDAGTTKNREGRVCPMTDDLRKLLEAQYAEHLQLKKAGAICPAVFVRMVADKRAGRSTRNLSVRSRRHGKRRASPLAVPVVFLTTSAGPRSATWCAAACPSASP
jgi:integrase